MLSKFYVYFNNSIIAFIFNSNDFNLDISNSYN